MAGMFETAAAGGGSSKAFKQQLNKVYKWYTGGFAIFVITLAVLEQLGLSREWIGFIFLLATIGLYAGIGIMSRTTDAAEYYVAGRRVPAVYNGMATGADWMSAASFIGMAGTLYLTGYSGLAFIMGWTGGYCLVALFLAPYLRKFGQFTIPDFLGERYGGNLPRFIGIFAAILCSFTYVVAQIYGVGLITSRLTGVAFELGVFLGLGGILVCSFLGGMRAVTWTQVAQYIILIIAYMIPVVWLSVKHTNIPVPPIAYGSAIAKLSERETVLIDDPKEKGVRAIFQQRAQDLDEKLQMLPESWESGRAEIQHNLEALKHGNAPLLEIKQTVRELATYPKDSEEAERRWIEDRAANRELAKPPTRHTEPFPGETEAASDIKRNNFMALVFCLMLGTAALPHVLVRYYTTSSVKEARDSVFWTLFFIMALYITIPALAVLVKYDIYTSLVGSDFSRLPEWVSYWANIDKIHPLVSINDVNRDGIVQLAEIVMDVDIVVLATPEIAGLPYVISGLIAAGGLAAALSTADGLLLTISNALSHDIYYKTVDPTATTQKRVTVSKLLLLMVALVAAYVASLKPGDILSLVGAAFSLAGSALFPALALGVIWKRANQQGAIAGMLVGFSVCTYYMFQTHPALGGSAAAQWFHIAPISAGVFGVPAGMLAIIIVSLLTPPPDHRTEVLLKHLRSP